MQNLETLLTSLPDYARDVKINLQTLLSSENSTLSQQQIFGAALASV